MSELMRFYKGIVFINKNNTVLDGLKVALPVSPGKNAAGGIAVDDYAAALAKFLVLSDKADKCGFPRSAITL